MGFAFPFDCPFRGGGGAKEYLIDGLFFGGRGGCFIAYRLTKLVESFSLKRRDRRKKLSINTGGDSATSTQEKRLNWEQGKGSSPPLASLCLKRAHRNLIAPELTFIPEKNRG